MSQTETSTHPHYTCSACGHTFYLADDAPHRCPQCLRTSGLILTATLEQSSAPRSGRMVWVAIALVGLAAAGFYLTPSPSSSERPQDIASTSDPTSQDGDAVLATVPDSLRLAPQRVNGAVRLVAESLPRDAEAIASRLAEAVAEGHLPPRPDEDPFLEAPRAAGILAPALTGKPVPSSGSLEKATLLGALLSAKGFESIRYGVDADAPGAATDISRRRYVVAVADGDWLSVDQHTVSPSVVQLTEATLLANMLAWRALGALGERQEDLASKASQTARTLAPMDAAVLFVSGQVQVLNGLSEVGLATMERAAGMRADGRTWFALGVMCVEANQPFKARQYLLKAAEGDRANAEPLVLLAHLALSRLNLTPESGHEGLIKEAMGHIEAAEAIDQNASGLATMKAQMLALADNTEGAEALLRAETERRPTVPDTWLDLAQFLIQTGQETSARLALEEGLSQGATGGEIQHNLGAMLAREGRLPEAALKLERAYEIEPDLPGLRLQLAQLKLELGDVNEARALLQAEADAPAGSTRDAKLLLAQLDLQQGKLKSASALTDEVLKQNGDDVEGQVLAYVLAIKGEGDLKLTRAATIKALGTRAAVAQVLLEQGILEEAERLLSEALELEPQDATAPVLLTALLLSTGRQDEAAELKTLALSKIEDPKEREALEALFASAAAQAVGVAPQEMPTAEPAETPSAERIQEP